MNELNKVVNISYGIVATVTLGLGAAAFLMFFAGFLIGGATATRLAVTAGNWIVFAIRAAALATLLGLINIYLQRKHSLTLNQD